LPERQVVKRGGQGRAVLVWREGERVRAYKAYCTHQGMELMAAGIRGNEITCVQHGWRFSLPGGSCAHGERWALRELTVAVDGGRVSVEWRG